MKVIVVFRRLLASWNNHMAAIYSTIWNILGFNSTAGIFLASILLKEMRYLVYIRYLWDKRILLKNRNCVYFFKIEQQRFGVSTPPSLLSSALFMCTCYALTASICTDRFNLTVCTLLTLRVSMLTALS
jgi:hypothetical protein